MKREQKRNIEKLEKVIEEKKRIPKNIKDKINSKIFENTVIVAIIIIYLAALNIGMGNIQTDMYLMDLKVFSIILLITTILLFEYGYKKDNGELWLHGVEVMTIAIFTLYLIYLYSIYYLNYGTVLAIVGIIYLVYYIAKILITKKRIKKHYKETLKDITDIVKN